MSYTPMTPPPEDLPPGYVRYNVTVHGLVGVLIPTPQALQDLSVGSFEEYEAYWRWICALADLVATTPKTPSAAFLAVPLVDPEAVRAWCRENLGTAQSHLIDPNGHVDPAVTDWMEWRIRQGFVSEHVVRGFVPIAHAGDAILAAAALVVGWDGQSPATINVRPPLGTHQSVRVAGVEIKFSVDSPMSQLAWLLLKQAGFSPRLTTPSVAELVAVGSASGKRTWLWNTPQCRLRLL